MEFLSATTDLWSSEVMHPYISLTIHFVNQSRTYVYKLLSYLVTILVTILLKP